MNRCACAEPKPIDVLDEEFVGLFDDAPLYADAFVMCARCGLEIDPRPGVDERNLDGPAPLPDEFPNDGGDAEHDFTEEDVVS